MAEGKSKSINKSQKGLSFNGMRTSEQKKIATLIKMEEGISFDEQVREALSMYYKKKSRGNTYKEYL